MKVKRTLLQCCNCDYIFATGWRRGTNPWLKARHKNRVQTGIFWYTRKSACHRAENYTLIFSLLFSLSQLTPRGFWLLLFSHTTGVNRELLRDAENVWRFHFARVIVVGNFRCSRTPESHWECKLNSRIMIVIFDTRLLGQLYR